MYPISDPQFLLDLHHQRVGQLIREADAYRLGKGHGRHVGRRHRASARPRPARSQVAL
jgi:hypothetical protein